MCTWNKARHAKRKVDSVQQIERSFRLHLLGSRIIDWDCLLGYSSELLPEMFLAGCSPRETAVFAARPVIIIINMPAFPSSDRDSNEDMHYRLFSSACFWICLPRVAKRLRQSPKNLILAVQKGVVFGIKVLRVDKLCRYCVRLDL